MRYFEDNTKGGLLTSFPFILALTLLLTNDFLLKQTIPGWFTGKLSDFAGLFAFVVFFSAITPLAPWVVGSITSIAFILWKAPVSDPLIVLLNRILPGELVRTVDYSDLLALTILPVALFWLGTRSKSEYSSVPRPFSIVVICISAFAFFGTSCQYHLKPLPEGKDGLFTYYRYSNEDNLYLSSRRPNDLIQIDLSKEELIRQLKRKGFTVNKVDLETVRGGRLFDETLYHIVPHLRCCGSGNTVPSDCDRFDLAIVSLFWARDSYSTQVWIRRLRICEEGSADGMAKALASFLANVLGVSK